MRTPAPFSLTLLYPESGEGRRALAKQVADIHADTVLRRIQALDWPPEQKIALLEGIQTQDREQT